MSEQMPAGYVWNCYTKSREGDGPLFVAHDDTVTARLDGYAIVPREEYDAALARVVRLEAALRPFAASVTNAEDYAGVGIDSNYFRWSIKRITIDEWLAAAAALADAPGEKT